MNCEKTALYMSALMDDELPAKDSLDVVDHINQCSICKSKWELGEETRSKLIHYVTSIKASDDLRKRISNQLEPAKNVVYLKPMLIAASIVFLLGLGMIFNLNFVQSPSLAELHHRSNVQLVSNDVDLLSDYINVGLKKEHFSNFEKANYKPGAAGSIKRLLGNSGFISLVNNEGEKISLCFLPKDYKLNNCHTKDFGGNTVFCGTCEHCHFAYWRQGGGTVALISDGLNHGEMINLALPIIKGGPTIL